MYNALKAFKQQIDEPIHTHDYEWPQMLHFIHDTARQHLIGQRCRVLQRSKQGSFSLIEFKSNKYKLFTPRRAFRRIARCPYCNAGITLHDSNRIYGTSYGKVWMCSNWPKCDSYVGTHKGTTTPLGTLADGVTRHWRIKLHRIFDPLWQTKQMPRGEAYHLLSGILKLTTNEAHIAMFNLNQCMIAVHALITLKGV